MSTLKTVFNKLTKEDKVELKSEKIELANFADIKTQIGRAEKLYNEVLDYTDKIYNLKQKAKKNRNHDLLDRIVRELESDQKDFVSRVKELGINPNKIPQPKQYDDAIKKISLLAERAKKMYSEFI